MAVLPGEQVPPVIDEITVEKEEVCEGEENLITVKAHTLDGVDPLLHASIGGERGMSVPLRTYIREDKARQIPKALKILKQDTVSQEDLWRLEREGQL